MIYHASKERALVDRKKITGSTTNAIAKIGKKWNAGISFNDAKVTLRLNCLPILGLNCRDAQLAQR
jgi:hypothetical protein